MSARLVLQGCVPAPLPESHANAFLFSLGDPLFGSSYEHLVCSPELQNSPSFLALPYIFKSTQPSLPTTPEPSSIWRGNRSEKGRTSPSRLLVRCSTWRPTDTDVMAKMPESRSALPATLKRGRSHPAVSCEGRATGESREESVCLQHRPGDTKPARVSFPAFLRNTRLAPSESMTSWVHLLSPPHLTTAWRQPKPLHRNCSFQVTWPLGC